jgi:hypothetical protein
VAADTGQSVQAIYEQPYALTLYTFYLLGIRNRIERSNEAGLIQTLVNGICLAFNDPRELRGWGDDVERSYGLKGPRDRQAEREAAADRVARMTDALLKGKRTEVR